MTKTKTQHTPGPLTIAYCDDSQHSGAGTSMIWAVLDSACNIVAKFPGDDRGEDAARLYAAAPDMLHFLKELCEDNYNDLPGYITTKAKNLIAKAEAK